MHTQLKCPDGSRPRILFAEDSDTVRLVTAANVPLESKLRPDLIFRLKDVVLALPPLRTRGDDIWRLVRAFLRQYAPAGRPASLSMTVTRPEAPASDESMRAAWWNATARCGSRARLPTCWTCRT